MSLSSSLASSVTGLNANATKISGTSDNIANSNTIGYKRVDTEFSSMVMPTNTSNIYSAGGVETYIHRTVDETGLLMKTSNNFDMAVTQGSFLPVTTVVDPENFNGGSDPVRFGVTGQFAPDTEGFLKNSQGQFLLGWPVDQTGALTTNPSTTSTLGMEVVNIRALEYSVLPTSEIRLSGNMAQQYTDATINSTTPKKLITEEVSYYTPLGFKKPLTVVFTPSNTLNEWNVSVYDSALADIDPATNQVGDYTVTFNGDGSVNQSGSIASVVDNSVPAAPYDPLTGDLAIDVDGANTMPINLFIGKLNAPNAGAETMGIRQSAQGGTPTIDDLEETVNISGDGSALGKWRGAELDEDGSGLVYALFDNGARVPIYKVPVAVIKNPNALEALDGQIYALTAESGGFEFKSAGDENGKIFGNNVMRSTVDIAEELTSLIETQRAYSSNAKVIQTVDEMFQETTNIKR